MDFVSARNTRSTFVQFVKPVGLQFQVVRTDFVVDVFSRNFRIHFVSRPVFSWSTSRKNYGTNFLLLLSSNSYNWLQKLFSCGSEEGKEGYDRLESIPSFN